MEKHILFPKVGTFVHGGDYNPDQWLDRPDILKEDIRLMKEAGVNCVTLGVFAWSTLEPRKDEFHFEWMKEIMDNLYENGIYTILATPSGAKPAWLDEEYPEALRVDPKGMRRRHGVRHNPCMSSPKLRERVRIVDRKLAENFGSHPGLIMYHISNELGGMCFCPLCADRFRQYLSDKFDHDIEKLNHAWWAKFWSHTYNSFDQIEPPFANGETSMMGLNLEWKRFTTWNMNDFMMDEIRTLKEVTPDIPVTTNFMDFFYQLDYRKMVPGLDAVSWDSYPQFHNDYESFADTMYRNAFNHALMRSMKPDRPFMLMESAPDLPNWHEYNKMKRPGVHKLACLQAVANGSDTVQYFQWRQSRGSYEQFHGAVVGHKGTDDTRIFKEVAEVGEILKKISPVAGTLVKARAALLVDWDNRWAIDDVMALGKRSKNYDQLCRDIWTAFEELGIEMDIVASDSDLSRYDVAVAPMLYLLEPDTAQNLKEFVARGGQLLATYFTGYVDDNQLCYLGGFPGDGLTELFGVESEEIDTLYPSDRNAMVFEDGTSWEVRDYAEVLNLKGADTLAVYESDYYQGKPALTSHRYGEGTAYYIAARVTAEQMKPLFTRMAQDAGVPVKDLPAGVEYHLRSGEEGSYAFYLNDSTEEVRVSDVYGTDLVTDAAVDGTLKLQAYGVAVVKL
ncbi:MAG: beta-galactosidase [Lachnospiraceae bacterium]|nr:beta-galactosidase [Lachnospiraceae bacterium]